MGDSAGVSTTVSDFGVEDRPEPLCHSPPTAGRDIDRGPTTQHGHDQQQEQEHEEDDQEAEEQDEEERQDVEGTKKVQSAVTATLDGGHGLGERRLSRL